jgi:phage portal protein BeeE
MPSAAGVKVNRQTALAVSALFACVQVLAQDLGKVPCLLYRRKGKGKERRGPPIYRLIHRRPNPAQSSYQFKQMAQWHNCLRGNSYSLIVTGRDGSIEALRPLHPDRMIIEYLSADGWTYRYKYTTREGNEVTLLPDEVLHMRGLAVDGVLGLSPSKSRRSRWAGDRRAAVLGAHARERRPPRGWINTPATSKPRRTSRSSARAAGSPDRHEPRAHRNFGIRARVQGARDQERRSPVHRGPQAQDVDMARIFRVPPHKIGILDKATHSNIEQQAIEYVTDTMMSWLTNWEQELSAKLLTEEEQEEYRFEFLVDVLMRGDAVMRGQFYMTGIQAGWLTRNGRARAEPEPAEGLDEPLQPLNMASAGRSAAGGAQPEPAPEDEEEDEQQARRTRRLELPPRASCARKQAVLGFLKRDRAQLAAAVRDFMTSTCSTSPR